MLIQLHHQLSSPTIRESKLIAQIEIPEEASALEYRTLVHNMIDECSKRYPVPKGYQWMICNEKSEYFVKGKENLE